MTGSTDSPPRYDDLARHLAAGKHVREAARLASVSESTAYRAMRKPAFRRRVSAYRSQARDAVAGELAEASREAVATLVQMLGDTTPATARLGAARAILEYGAKYAETQEMDARIAALEAKQRRSSYATT